jgi:hypothetical protein
MKTMARRVRNSVKTIMYRESFHLRRKRNQPVYARPTDGNSKEVPMRLGSSCGHIFDDAEQLLAGNVTFGHLGGIRKRGYINPAHRTTILSVTPLDLEAT